MNKKCPPKVEIFECLVSSWQPYAGRLCWGILALNWALRVIALPYF